MKNQNTYRIGVKVCNPDSSVEECEIKFTNYQKSRLTKRMHRLIAITVKNKDLNAENLYLKFEWHGFEKVIDLDIYDDGNREYVYMDIINDGIDFPFLPEMKVFMLMHRESEIEVEFIFTNRAELKRITPSEF